MIISEKSKQCKKLQIHPFKSDHINEIIPEKLYITNYQVITHYPELVYEMGFDSIVSVLEYVPFSDIDEPIEYEKIEIYHFDIEDNSKENIKQFFKKFKEIMDTHNKVLIHCYGGISRSATIAISYMMNTLSSSLEDIDVQDLVYILKKIRPCINPNPGFIKQLEEYRLEILNKYK